MTSDTLLGFDFGQKSIGVAVGSTHTGLAQPLTIITNGKHGPDWARIAQIIEEWRPISLVVGLPLNMDGSDNPRTRAARQFGERLAARYNLPVYRVDERLTTRAARAVLADQGIDGRRVRKADLDKRAAQTILQGFLDDPDNRREH